MAKKNKKNKNGEERALYVDLYRQMVLIRLFEERVHDLFLRGEVYGSTHLCIGQAAVCAGLMSALGGDDRGAGRGGNDEEQREAGASEGSCLDDGHGVWVGFEGLGSAARVPTWRNGLKRARAGGGLWEPGALIRTQRR